MSKFTDEALIIKSFLNNSEFDRMTLPKVMGKIISTLPELTYQQCWTIAEAITLPRPQKLTEKEYTAYKKRMKREGIEFPPPEEDDVFHDLSDEELKELELLLEKRAKERNIQYEDDFDNPIGVSGDGYMIYGLKQKRSKR